LIVQLVMQVRRRHPKMGTRKLYKLLAEQIHWLQPGMGRDKFLELLRSRNLLVKRTRKQVITTQSYQWYRVYSNLLLDFKPCRPDQVWVCDITYIRLLKGFCFLFLITDSYSRMIVGWRVTESLATAGALMALKMALKQCRRPTGLIHHSDRGFQYCSGAYVSLLKQNDIKSSMAEAGNCYENAMAERMNGILKYEYGLENTFKSIAQVRMAAKEAIAAYNYERPHWSLGLQIPAQVHQQCVFSNSRETD
jgi:putative transposase